MAQDETMASAATAPQDHETKDHEHKSEKLSDLLFQIVRTGDSARISIADLLVALEHRAIGALLFIFAAPNALPMPPGTSSILGAPLIFLTLQLAVGRKAWLPRIIRDRSLTRSEMTAVVEKLGPWLAKAEALFRPRFEIFARGWAENVVGVLSLVLAIVLVLPIPLGNMLPAFAISIMSLGLLARDGLWTLIGFITGVMSLFIVSGVVYGLAIGAIFVVRQFLGW